jgi:hypothetical protein
MPPGEAAHLVRLIRPALIATLIILLWLLFQIIPIGAFPHPIWISANTALSSSVIGSISINPGASLTALIGYSTSVGIFLTATALTIDRQRAEFVLFALAGLLTLTALVLPIHNLGGFYFLGEINSTGPRAAIGAAAILGTILATATVVCAIERYETRHRRGDFTTGSFLRLFSPALLAFVLCWTAILFSASGAIAFAALCGLATLTLLILCRRLGLDSKFGVLLAMAVIAVPACLVAVKLLSRQGDYTLRFAADAPAELVETTQRMIADVGWLGAGAGSFPALLPIYQTTDRPLVASNAPTTAAEIVIALGEPALWVFLLLSACIVIYFIRGALLRGRDSFFPAAGAASVVATVVEAFCDASLLTTTVTISVATILGLSLAQSVSRTARESGL